MSNEIKPHRNVVRSILAGLAVVAGLVSGGSGSPRIQNAEATSLTAAELAMAPDAFLPDTSNDVTFFADKSGRGQSPGVVQKILANNPNSLLRRITDVASRRVEFITTEVRSAPGHDSPMKKEVLVLISDKTGVVQASATPAQAAALIAKETAQVARAKRLHVPSVGLVVGITMERPAQCFETPEQERLVPLTSANKKNGCVTPLQVSDKSTVSR